jgi:hypothetical protein
MLNHLSSARGLENPEKNGGFLRSRQSNRCGAPPELARFGSLAEKPVSNIQNPQRVSQLMDCDNQSSIDIDTVVCHPS